MLPSGNIRVHPLPPLIFFFLLSSGLWVPLAATIDRGHVCWDEHDLVDGRPTGLVRVSLGWMSTWEDAAAFVAFVRKHFVVETPLQVCHACVQALEDSLSACYCA